MTDYGTGICFQVHIRVASPPLRYPCYMGINIPTRNELIANQLDLQQLAEFIGKLLLCFLLSLLTLCFTGLLVFYVAILYVCLVNYTASCCQMSLAATVDPDTLPTNCPMHHDELLRPQFCHTHYCITLRLHYSRNIQK